MLLFDAGLESRMLLVWYGLQLLHVQVALLAFQHCMSYSKAVSDLPMLVCICMWLDIL